MRKSLLGVSMSLAFAACGQPQAAMSTDATAPPAEQPASSDTAKMRASVEGWETDLTAFARNGSTLPPFAMKQPDGPELTHENLRDRWTILAFIGRDAGGKSEKDYVAALNSAADQDPDLDFLAIRPAAQPTDTTVASTPWPTLDDTAGFAQSLGIDQSPAYLLIGPDLTIEGYRGALSATPDDGIKSVIRGIAEIRKQIAAPE